MNTQATPHTRSGPLHELAAGYVLGTLSARQRTEVEARLPQEPALRAAVTEWEERLLPLASMAEPVEPSSSLWQRIEQSVAALMPASTTAAGSRETRSGLQDWWNSLNFWR